MILLGALGWRLRTGPESNGFDMNKWTEDTVTELCWHVLVKYIYIIQKIKF